MKYVVDTDVVKVFVTIEGYHPMVRMKDGGWIEMAAFPPNAMGLVNALDFCVNAASGKFYPRRVMKENKKETLMLTGGVS